MNNAIIEGFKRAVYSALKANQNCGIYGGKKFLIDKNSVNQIIVYYGGYAINMVELS